MSERQRFSGSASDYGSGQRAEGDSDYASRMSRMAALQQRLGNGAIQLKTKKVGSEGIMAALQEFAPPPEAMIPSDGPALPTSGGEPLPVQLQESLSEKAGTNLDDVTIHRDSSSHAALDGLNAEAATQGTHVHLGPNVDIHSPSGQDTLLHELRHVGQQKRGEADGLDGTGGDPSRRVELERDADKR
jgi:hypothetical protein